MNKEDMLTVTVLVQPLQCWIGSILSCRSAGETRPALEIIKMQCCNKKEVSGCILKRIQGLVWGGGEGV